MARLESRPFKPASDETYLWLDDASGEVTVWLDFQGASEWG
jgi:hypothetical protein